MKDTFTLNRYVISFNPLSDLYSYMCMSTILGNVMKTSVLTTTSAENYHILRAHVRICVVFVGRPHLS